MTNSGYVVVPAEAAPANQILGRVAFFNVDGTPWAPGGEGGPATVEIGDVAGLESRLSGIEGRLEALEEN